jgi:hypothetical protein
MNAAADNRIAVIREKAREEHALLSGLNDRIGADLKKLLQPASFHLDDVEGFLLPQFLGHPHRSEREMAKWLDFVEGILDRAIKHRKWVEGFIKKFGPDARVVGGQRETG